MKKTASIIILVLGLFGFQITDLKSQITLPFNVNQISSQSYHYTSSNPLYPINWILEIKNIQNDFVHVGYVENTIKHPNVCKLDVNGTKLWETNLECLVGMAYCVLDNPNGYLVFREGERVNGCSDPHSLFSVLLDKTTGDIVGSYGIKFYNEQTLPFPNGQNGQLLTYVGSCANNRPKFCEIIGSGGSILGYMVCGNYFDRSIPSTTGASLNYSNGSFLLKLDASGKPDASFGNQGLVFYNINVTNKYFNSHFLCVAVNYAPGGSTIKGYMIAGYRNENLSVVTPLIGNTYDYDTDAFIMSVDPSGAVLWEDVYDESSHFLTSPTPVSIISVDNPENNVCAPSPLVPPIPGLKNNNQRATRLVQNSTTGEFYVLNQFCYSLFYYQTGCSLVYPPSNIYFVSADPYVFSIDPTTSSIGWITNVNQSMGADFENDLIYLQATKELLVLGATCTDPGTASLPPADQRAVVSKINALNGNIVYEQAYLETSSSQTMFCPFSFCLNGADCLIGGDADGSSSGNDYFEIVTYSY